MTTQPKPMSAADLAPELSTDFSNIPRLPVESRLGRWLLRRAAELLYRGKQHEGVRVSKVRLNQHVDLWVYVPTQKQSDAALLWIHGGGYVIGHALQDDTFCADTARELGIVIVATNYRLAPEFPFPAPLDDCYAAWQWLQANADQHGVHKQRVAIGGRSAGGGLAASLVQRIHDTGGVQPIAQWLFCPMLDDRTATRRELDARAHFVWTNQNNLIGWQSYLGAKVGADTPPPAYAVPARRVDLSGLPAAWIGTGDIELFFEENKAYAERLNAAGVDCTLDVVAGAPHGFESIIPQNPLAKAYLTRSRQWLRQCLNEAHCSHVTQRKNTTFVKKLD